MKNLQKFDEFVNESADTYGNVSDPSGNIDPFVRHAQDLTQQQVRLQGIIANLYATSQGSFGSGSAFDFEIEDLTIVRIYPNGNGSLDMYLRFEYEGKPFYGTFKNWASVSGSRLETSFYKSVGFTRENHIKFEGIVRRALLDWFKPKLGTYSTMKDVKTYDDAMGAILYIPTNSVVEVEDVFTEEDKPIIYIRYNEKLTTLSGNDYYYFNWWFQKRQS